ncbi:hypothetical protein [Lentilactobacillus parabuchneri]|uniref:hypothetical protein n=1 Tax=Lentilactobacillus parabuchneri TaxID=152331 RepID=UPI002307A9CB|nr:hypothetical protein [Lentilactobacillus parabuchneri]MDB1104638.1 hypothetical protein [Lentilactobacillus parabuchneri]
MATKYLFSPIVRLVLHTKSKPVEFDYRQDNDETYEIHFNVPFSDSGSPATCSAEIMNLSAKHRAMFQPGLKVDLYFGYKLDGVGLLSSGTIRHTSPLTSDGTNETFSFTFREGEEYADAESSAQKANDKSNKKLKAAKKALGKKKAESLYKVKRHSALSFAKGVNYETIIRKVAIDAGIKLKSVKLAKPKVAHKGYTAHGRPWTIIQKLAKACGSQAFLRRGAVYIDDLSKSKAHKESVLITDHVKGYLGGSGLTAYPTTDQLNAQAKHATWTIVSLLRYQVSTGSLITIKNSYLTGSFRVKSGEHTFDGSAATTTMEVYV